MHYKIVCLQIDHGRSEVLTALLVNIQVFWDVICHFDNSTLCGKTGRCDFPLVGLCWTALFRARKVIALLHLMYCNLLSNKSALLCP